MFNDLIDKLIRWRTYVLNILLAALFILPDLLNSREILAIIPIEHQRWLLVAAFLANIWLRPRAASRPMDTEVQVKQALKATDGPSTVTIKSGTEKTVILDA